jgi:flagellar biosynthesis protein FlhG
MALRRAAAAGVAAPSAPGNATVFAIGSGKGGVGKSTLSILLAASMARAGQRVLLFDGSQNQGNLHVMLGIRRAGRLGALIDGEATLDELIVPVEPSLWLLPAESGDDAIHALTPTDRARLHHRLSNAYDEFDAVVVDAGPGIDGVMRAMIRAGRLVVVCIPEPASLSDAYAVIKIGTLQSPGLPVDLIVNRAAGPEVEATHERLNVATERFLKRSIRLLGAVPEDPALRDCARVPGRLLEAQPPCAAQIAVEALAVVLGSARGEAVDVR